MASIYLGLLVNSYWEIYLKDYLFYTCLCKLQKVQRDLKSLAKNHSTGQASVIANNHIYSSLHNMFPLLILTASFQVLCRNNGHILGTEKPGLWDLIMGAMSRQADVYLRTNSLINNLMDFHFCISVLIVSQRLIIIFNCSKYL